MPKLIAAALVAATIALAGCHNSPSDRLAAQVENVADVQAASAENAAAVLRDQAAMLENQAHDARDSAESRADAIRAADQNTAALTPEQRDAIVANQAPAVR